MPHPILFLIAIALAGYLIHFTGSRGQEMVTEGLIWFAEWNESDAVFAGKCAGALVSVATAYFVYRMFMREAKDAGEL